MKYDLRAIGKKDKARALRLKRKARVRKIISGTGETPRLSIFKSAKHIYIQAIDDQKGVTIASVGTCDKGMSKDCQGLKKQDVAKKVGENMAKKLQEAGVKTAVFDRNGFRYIGRVSAVAESLREAGVKI